MFDASSWLIMAHQLGISCTWPRMHLASAARIRQYCLYSSSVCVTHVCMGACSNPHAGVATSSLSAWRRKQRRVGSKAEDDDAIGQGWGLQFCVCVCVCMWG